MVWILLCTRLWNKHWRKWMTGSSERRISISSTCRVWNSKQRPLGVCVTFLISLDELKTLLRQSSQQLPNQMESKIVSWMWNHGKFKRRTADKFHLQMAGCPTQRLPCREILLLPKQGLSFWAFFWELSCLVMESKPQKIWESLAISPFISPTESNPCLLRILFGPKEKQVNCPRIELKDEIELRRLYTSSLQCTVVQAEILLAEIPFWATCACGVCAV